MESKRTPHKALLANAVILPLINFNPNFDPNDKGKVTTAKVTGKEELLKVMLVNTEMCGCSVRKNILDSTPKASIPNSPEPAVIAAGTEDATRKNGKAPDLQHQAEAKRHQEVADRQVEATTAGLRAPYHQNQHHPEMMMRPRDRKFQDGLVRSLGKMDTRSIAPVQPAGPSDPVALQAQAVASAIAQYQVTKAHEGIQETRNQALAAYDKHAAESKQELEDLIKKYASGDYLTTPTTTSLGASGTGGYFAGAANSGAHSANGAMNATSPMEGVERTGSIAPVAPMAPPMTTMSASAGAQQRRLGVEEQRRLSLEGQRIMNMEEQRRRSSSGLEPSGPMSDIDASRDPRRRR